MHLASDFYFISSTVRTYKSANQFLENLLTNHMALLE